MENKPPILTSSEYAKIIPDDMADHANAYAVLVGLDLEAYMESEDANALQKALASCVRLIKELIPKNNEHDFARALSSLAELRHRIEWVLGVLRMRVCSRQNKRCPTLVNSQEFKKRRVASTIEEVELILAEEEELRLEQREQMRERLQKLQEALPEADKAIQDTRAQLESIRALVQKRAEIRAELEAAEEECEANMARFNEKP
jgi:hypothetical protein